MLTRWTTSGNVTPQSSVNAPMLTSCSRVGSVLTPRRLARRRPLARRRQGLVKIGDDVARVFDADRKPDHVFGDAGFDLLDDVELLMRRGRGVDHERLRVADVRE